MRGWIAAALLVSLTTGCDFFYRGSDGTGDDDDDDDAATPLNFVVTITGVGGGGGGPASNGETALIRFKRGTTVDACITSGAIAGGNATLASTAATIVSGAPYDVIELFINDDGNSTWDMGTDFGYTHPAITTTSDIILAYDDDDPGADGWNGPGNLSWANGTGCPGE